MVLSIARLMLVMGRFLEFLPLFGRGAGVRVGPLGFWGSAPGFCCFCRDLGVMTIFRTGKILKRVQDDRLLLVLGTFFVFSLSLGEGLG